MAKIRYIAIATQEPDKTARYYKEVFDLQEVGRVDDDDAEGYYLSDGHVDLAILRFKNDVVFGTGYRGIHHIGFQVDDPAATDTKLGKANSTRSDDINSAPHSSMGSRHGGRHVEHKYSGPDGVMIDISRNGWVCTGDT